MTQNNDFAGEEKFAGVIRLDEGQLRSHVDGVVREAVGKKGTFYFSIAFPAAGG
jgi:hypothetical protein